MSETINLRGSIVAIITPFNKNGQIDETALRELVEWHIAEGTDGIVPCGTTGESATLSHGEHDKVVEIVIETVNRRIPVIAGAGSNSTTEAIRLTKHAASVEADFVLSITPYYNKPTQNGLIAHFTRIADESPIPLILYNVPGRTGVNMLPATVAACAKHPRIAGIKEATADLKQISEIIENTPKDFIVLSGDDFTVVPTLAIGGKGVISVTANIAPRLNSEMIKAWESVDIEKAKALHYRLLPLARACFNESNPIPVKAGVSLLGKCNNKVRSPLTEASQATIDKMKSAIESLNSR
ncbi:MAG: 4-hydroxy-tetrahydrodipicolinate synthase [Candidatus Hydrogenedentes bacterium CG07_land_8_20_14_0_80_42_17]|nr:MAG: 4-hydroxy-tetrahydrodipicolinate synthase [Candidatus Hydrogenedentes bacterium CG07_land_8_20_14_0_80_42_17]